MAFWRKEFSREEVLLVLEKIKGLRKRTPEGKISLSGIGDVDAWTAFLISAAGFEVRTDTLKSQIIKATLFSQDLPMDFVESDLKAQIYKIRSQFQNENLVVYRVAFPIWNKPDFLTGVRRYEDVTVNFTPSRATPLFRNILASRNSQVSGRYYGDFFTSDRKAELEKCSVCVLRVKAHDPSDAYERAAQTMYEILGLINIAKDGGKYWRMSSRVGGKLPVSEVLIAPHTTTHLEDGRLSHDGFWHEDWVGGPTPSKLNSDHLRAWKLRFESLSASTAKSNWPNECKSASARYFKAFSNPNLEESFLEGWRLFENITGSRYEKIENKITRASNVFEDNIEYRIIGKHLALRRNLIAHGHAIKTDDDETLAFQMLQFVLPFLTRFIRNQYSFSSPREFQEFLDISASQDKRVQERAALQRRLELLNKAAEFRGVAT